MRILFLTVFRITDISEKGIYTDLIRKFSGEGHDVFVVSPSERRYGKKTGFHTQDGVKLLSVRTPNFQKTNLVEKGISTILFERLFSAAINKYIPDEKIDLVLYSTPPITFTKLIAYCKNKYAAGSYLLLKDIFPQNAVDLGMIRKNGLLYNFFRRKERKLYAISDHIGCMSPANVNYLLSHNKTVSPQKVEICPNTVTPSVVTLTNTAREAIRNRYNISAGATVCIYGGNLGKPQGIEFLLQVLQSNLNDPAVFFIIAGNGTAYAKTEKWFLQHTPDNALLKKTIPVREYNELVLSCDIGLIFLDRRFTIPNFPSRLLSYMECGLPVLTATDPNTDIGKIVEDNGFGFGCISGNIDEFNSKLALLVQNRSLRSEMGSRSRKFLEQAYTSDHAYQIIMDHFQ